MDKFGNFLLCVGGCVSLGNLFFNNFTFTLPEDKYAIVAKQKRNTFQAKYLKQQDKFVDDYEKLKTISTPGIHFLIPFRKSLTFYDKTSNQTIIQQKVPNLETKLVDISLALNYTLSPEKLPLLHENYGDEYQLELVDKKMSKLIPILLKKYNMQFLIFNKAKLENEILSIANQMINKYCKINSTSIITIKYSNKNEDKIQEQVQKLKKQELLETERNQQLYKQKYTVENRMLEQVWRIRDSFIKKFNLQF